jgi:hypothetical protein
MKATGTEPSAANQPRRAITPMAPKTMDAQIGVLRFLRDLASENPAIASIATPERTPSVLESISRVGS